MSVVGLNTVSNLTLLTGQQKLQMARKTPLLEPDPKWNNSENKGQLNNENSSGDEIANVNFFYNDILHALQNIDCC